MKYNSSFYGWYSVDFAGKCNFCHKKADFWLQINALGIFPVRTRALCHNHHIQWVTGKLDV